MYASDITRQNFEKIISPDFLQQSILSDMDFKEIDNQGFHYQATICIPESSVCNIINLLVTFDGKLIIDPMK